MKSLYAGDAMEIGQFQISRISDFRHPNSGPLADELDAATVTRAGKDFISDAEVSANSPRVQALQGMIDVGAQAAHSHANPDGGGLIQDVEFLRFSPDYWALCLSARFGSAAANYYDASIEISDLHAFAGALRQAHQDVLGPWQIGRMRYMPRRFTLDDGLQLPDHFIKEPRFAPEEEIRIVWQPVTNDMGPIRTSALNATRYLKRVR